VSGSASRLVISHPEAALYIQVPTLATTVAIQTTLNALCRNAIQGEARGSVTGALCLSSGTVMFLTLPKKLPDRHRKPIASAIR
jgi:hypothetical protein